MIGAEWTDAHASSRARAKAMISLLVSLLVVIGVLAPSVPAHAADAPPAVTAGIVPAADLTKFQPGNIIGDAVFFNRSSMTEAQIQSFLQARVPTCTAGYTCLKDWYDTSRTVAADAMCGAYSGGVRERASRIIYKVAQACGINPQVILATLQKEQGLVTHVWPSDWRYTIAMGQGCPDTAACDTRYYGFFNQVYGAAWQFKRYANPPGTSRVFTWYAPGNTWNILYHPNRACGTSPVHIQNQATANLYYYTPYRPNVAALSAGYGTGDSCSSYGNRNFFSYFTDWFGSTQYNTFTSMPTPGISGTALSGQVLTANAGTWAPAPSSLGYQWLRNGTPVSGATSSTYRVTTDDGGAQLAVRVTAQRAAYVTVTRDSAAVPATSFTVTRLSGDSRYDTAIAVSKQTHPTGATTVYLATGAQYADALAASAVAARQGAALLLAPPSTMPANLVAELKRLAPASVVLVGGTGALDATTEARVRAVLGPAVAISRLAGADRFETARLVARAGGPATTAYIATGRDFPDALGAAGIAGSRGAPVILVDGGAQDLDDATVETLRSRGVTSVVIVGGTGVVSSGIATRLTSLGMAVTRYGGANRYATNTALIAGSFGASMPRAVTATGLDFPDALTGSMLAAMQAAPMFVTPPTCAVASMADMLRDRGGASVTVVGGPGAVSDAAAKFRRC